MHLIEISVFGFNKSSFFLLMSHFLTFLEGRDEVAGNAYIAVHTTFLIHYLLHTPNVMMT